MSLFQGPKNKNTASIPRQNNEETAAVQPITGTTPQNEPAEKRMLPTDALKAGLTIPVRLPPNVTLRPPTSAEAILGKNTASIVPPSFSPTPEGRRANPPTKAEFLEDIGANRRTPPMPDKGPTKAEFLADIGANLRTPPKPDKGPTKAEFLADIGANRRTPPLPDKGPTKAEFLADIGANRRTPPKPDKGPTKAEFLADIGANRRTPPKPDVGPTKKEFLESLKHPYLPKPVAAPTTIAAETAAIGAETAAVETPILAPTTEVVGGAAPTKTSASETPKAPEATPEIQAGEEVAAEALPAEVTAPVKDAAAEVPGAPGEGEGEKAKPKVEREKSKGFLAAVANIKKTAEEQSDHAPAQDLSVEAQAAAEVPENESMGDAQAAQVDEMAEQEPMEFSAANFKSMLMARIAEMKLPDTAEKADDFENNNNIAEVNKASKEDVQKEKDAAAGPIKSTNEKAPDPSAQPKRVAETLQPLDPGKKLKSAKANKAVPDPRPDSEVSQPLQDETGKLDNTMAANNVTDKQLEISQEPKFEKGLEGKNEAKAEAQKSTEQMRQQEAGTLQQTGEKAEGTSQEQLAGMNVMRGTSMQQVAGGQQTAGTKDTTEREKVAIKIDEIFTATQTDVTAILDTLDTDVNTKFEAATTRAKQAFEDHVDRRMNKYKYDRYLKYPGGLALWLVDAIAGMPDEVNEFFVEGRQVFIDEMDKEITIISEIVATKLNEAKQRVETGKQEVTDYVNSLPANLKAVGKEAADEIQDKFDELTEDVNAKQDELVDSMADQYSAALEEVDERIEEMKAANRGLVGMAMDMINGIIETIRKLTEAINNLLSAIASVIGIIMADPIGFMGMLFDGIGKGIDMFKANIEKHMLGGLVGWLTGSLGPMGITMPDDIFSLKGIFNLVMQVLGLGWDFLRAKSVKMMGEPMVNALETGSDMFKTFATKGVDGIWEYLKESFNDLKETVIDSIKGMLITQVIEAGIKWLLSLLIPGAGFIKAIMAIKDIIVFFVESAIMLIPAITEAILALAGGSIAGVGLAIEKGLGLLLPLVIGLFAKLIGLGGLTKRVMKIFAKIRKRVDKAVSKLLKKAKKAGRKLMRKLGIGKKKKKGKKPEDDKRTDAEKKADLHKGVQEGTAFIKQEGHDKKEIKKKLEQIEDKYDLKELKLVTDSENKGHIHGEVNPTEDGPMVPISFAGSTIKVGEHPLVGSGLESHHVPANNFSKTIADFYGEIGQSLTAGANFAELKEKLISRKDSIQSTYGEEGKGLSAILIHEKTHRTALKAVHGTEIQADVYKKIEEEANSTSGTGKTAVVVTPSTGEKRTIANLNSSHWKSFLEQVYRLEKTEGSVELNINSTQEGALITIKGGDKNANKRVAQEITAKANSIVADDKAKEESSVITEIVNRATTSGFEKALNNGIHAVSVALKGSTHDGDDKQYPNVLKELDKTARRIWKKIIINKI